MISDINWLMSAAKPTRANDQEERQSVSAPGKQIRIPACGTLVKNEDHEMWVKRRALEHRSIPKGNYVLKDSEDIV
jgi:hypothetical protein